MLQFSLVRSSTLSANPPIVLLGEAMGQNEEKIGAGFVGASGIELLRMLDEAGVIQLTVVDTDYLRRFWSENDPRLIDMVWRLHPEVHRLNVFNLHPQGNDMKHLCGDKKEALRGYPKHTAGWIRMEFAGNLHRLADDLNRLNPNLVIALGNTPLWALCGTTGISAIRGTTRLSSHTVADFKVLATYHPAAVLRQWELRPVTVADLMKAPAEAQYPEVRRPKREIWIEPEIADIERFFHNELRSGPLSIDIETAGTAITCIGFAPSSGIAIVIPFYDGRRKGKSYWPDKSTERQAWRLVKDVLEDGTIPKLFQNALFDVAFLYRSMGIKVRNVAEDTMLLHHALQPEMLKGLGFLGSLYTDEGAWKREHRHQTTIKKDN